MPFLLLSITAVLFYIAWQDFKFRAVYWWLFLLLTIGLCTAKILQSNWGSMLSDLSYNGIFLAAQLLFLSLYFSVKERRMVNIFDGYFGLGDLLFLISIMGYLSFLNYIFFYLGSLFFVMIISLVAKYLVKMKNSKIPLAGEQAILFIIWVLITQLNNITLISDTWIINYLNL